MASLLVLREKIKEFLGVNDAYIRPLFKFVVVFVALMILDSVTGYMEILGYPAVMLVLALACAFLPANCILLILMAYLLGQVYAVSMIAMVVLFVILLVMYLLYYHFTPKDSFILILTPVCFALHMPYLVPLLVGIFLTPFSIVSAAFGTFLYYALVFFNENGSALVATDEDAVSEVLAILLDGLINNQIMYAVIVVFAATIAIVYLVRILPMKYSYPYALVTGTIVQMVGFILMRLMVNYELSIGMLIGMSLLSLLIAGLTAFVVIPLDYSRTEVVRYEDDDYYYYVRAVPKYTVTKPNVKVKRINARKERRASSGRKRS
ncbi:MAG: ABC transporter permease [Lachnospiraceae bacterium]|nr:ABC transporter permease [Lachnospiraceae bacterium]